MEATPHTPGRQDPVAKAIAMLDMLDEATRQSVLDRMAPDARQRIEDRIATTPEEGRPHARFGNDVLAKRRLINDTAGRIHARRIQQAEVTTQQYAAAGAIAQPGGSAPAPHSTQASSGDPLDELRRVHPAALARAMQGERAEAWALVLDRLSPNARAALEMYIDAAAHQAIASARQQQAQLAPQLRRLIESSIASTVVPRALREHQLLLTSNPGVPHGAAL